MLTTVHILLAIIEFFLVNWIGKHSISSGYYQITFIQNYEDAPLFNLVFRVLAPSVFLVLCTSLFYALALDGWVLGIWRVTAFYFAVRWAFNIAMGRGGLLVWPNQIAIAVVATLLSVWIYRGFLTDRQAVIPSGRGLVDELWIIVILFLYQTFRGVSPFGSKNTLATRRVAYLKARYKLARRTFHSTIERETRSRYVELLTYSVLLYESFNRPRVYQFLERWVLFPIGLAKSLGPMQVRTAQALPVDDLVSAGARKLQRDFEVSVREEIGSDPVQASIAARRDNVDGVELPFDEAQDWSQLSADQIGYWALRRALERTLKKYNIRSDYPAQVFGIYDELQSHFYKDLSQG